MVALGVCNMERFVLSRRSCVPWPDWSTIHPRQQVKAKIVNAWLSQALKYNGSGHKNLERLKPVPTNEVDKYAAIYTKQAINVEIQFRQ